jgi:hypothetical protein
MTGLGGQTNGVDSSGNRTTMPKRTLSIWKRKSLKPVPLPTNGTQNDTQRTNARYLAAIRLLQEAISKRGRAWGSFEFTQLSGEPKDFNDTSFLAKINEVLDSQATGRITSKSAWEKCKRTLECAFLTMSPFAKVLLEMAQSNGASVSLPLYLLMLCRC